MLMPRRLESHLNVKHIPYSMIFHAAADSANSVPPEIRRRGRAPGTSGHHSSRVDDITLDGARLHPTLVNVKVHLGSSSWRQQQSCPSRRKGRSFHFG